MVEDGEFLRDRPLEGRKLGDVILRRHRRTEENGRDPSSAPQKVTREFGDHGPDFSFGVGCC